MVQEKGRSGTPTVGTAGLKLYVRTGVEYSEEGVVEPRYVIMPDGTRYEVSRVKRHQMVENMKPGSAGICYTVEIKGQEAKLYFEKASVLRWFVVCKRPVAAAAH